MIRIALVSCVKTKLPRRAPARELYTSPLFRGMRAYAESRADEWYILSAEHGLVHPRNVIEPYETTLAKMYAVDRWRWANRVCTQLDAILPRWPQAAEIVILAGTLYRSHITAWLRNRGHVITVPLEGLGIGRQLSYLKRCQQ